MTRRLVSTSQGTLHVTDIGDDAGSGTLMLLPILPFSSWLWRPAQSVFQKSGWRTIAVDPMGYGHSDKRAGPWAVEDHAANLAELLDRLALPRVSVLAGHLGALSAIELAASRPDRVSALVMDGPPVLTAESRNRLAAAPVQGKEWRLENDMGGDMWSRLTGMLTKLSPNGVEANSAAAVTLRRGLVDFIESSFDPASSKAMAHYDAEVRLRQIHCPTLLISSEHDTMRDSFPRFLAQAPHALTAFFDGVHPIHDIANPGRASEYVEVVAKFLNGAVA